VVSTSAKLRPAICVGVNSMDGGSPGMGRFVPLEVHHGAQERSGACCISAKRTARPYRRVRKRSPAGSIGGKAGRLTDDIRQNHGGVRGRLLRQASGAQESEGWQSHQQAEPIELAVKVVDVLVVDLLGDPYRRLE
jgi:hypothetical protein